jgi:hypothetical protein
MATPTRSRPAMLSGFCGHSKVHDRCLRNPWCACPCHIEGVAAPAPAPTGEVPLPVPDVLISDADREGAVSTLPAAVVDMLSADRARPRSSSGFGPSGLLDCKRAAYHQLNGDLRCNDDTDPWKAIVGTAIDAAYKQARLTYAIDGRADVTLTLGDLSGNADFIDDFEDLVEDCKSKGEKADIDAIRRYGPDPGDIAQITWYAVAAGKPRWRLVYVPREGKASDAYAVDGEVDQAVFRNAIDWYEQRKAEVVAQAPPEPEKDPVVWCQTYCDFYGELCPGRVISTDLPALDERRSQAARDYVTARDAKKAAEEAQKAAQALLDTRGIGSGVKVNYSNPKDGEEPDLDAIRADYTHAGRDLPTRVKPGVSRISVTVLKDQP